MSFSDNTFPLWTRHTREKFMPSGIFTGRPCHETCRWKNKLRKWIWNSAPGEFAYIWQTKRVWIIALLASFKIKIGFLTYAITTVCFFHIHVPWTSGRNTTRHEFCACAWITTSSEQQFSQTLTNSIFPLFFLSFSYFSFLSFSFLFLSLHSQYLF